MAEAFFNNTVTESPMTKSQLTESQSVIKMTESVPKVKGASRDPGTRSVAF
jgi:hypothetical protein